MPAAQKPVLAIASLQQNWSVTKLLYRKMLMQLTSSDPPSACAFVSLIYLFSLFPHRCSSLAFSLIILSYTHDLSFQIIPYRSSSWYICHSKYLSDRVNLSPPIGDRNVPFSRIKQHDLVHSSNFSDNIWTLCNCLHVT